MQLCEKIVMGLNHKGMIGSCIKLIHRIDIDTFSKWQKVKVTRSRSNIKLFENLIGLKITNRKFDLDQTYTYDWYP